MGCSVPRSVVFPRQLFRILGSDPQYIPNDHLWEKNSESKVMFLECASSDLRVLLFMRESSEIM
jgi:hypothetical protein